MKKLFSLFALSFLLSAIAPAQNATFEVTVNNSTAEIDTAIAFATRIWSEYLISEVPIKIQLNFIPVPGFLGLSLANARKNFPGAPIADRWYPASLANAMCGTPVNGDEPDMEIYMTSLTNWHYGTDGNPGPNQQDFISVFLHEIGHSLGMTSLCNVENGEGSFGRLTPPILPTTFTIEDLEGLPSIFDHYLIDGSDVSLMDTMVYPNESQALAGALTSNALYFNGDSARAANNGQAPLLYAPGSFDFGSSCTHLDQNTYRGTENGLMTPFSTSGEINQSPGPIFIGVLYDLGWNRPKEPTSIEPEPLRVSNIRLSPNPLREQLRVDYELEEGQEVQLLIRDAHGRLIYQSEAEWQQAGEQTLYWNSGANASGLYAYQLVVGNQLRAGILIKQ